MQHYTVFFITVNTLHVSGGCWLYLKDQHNYIFHSTQCKELPCPTKKMEP